jgi:hypothetical protein
MYVFTLAESTRPIISINPFVGVGLLERLRYNPSSQRLIVRILTREKEEPIYPLASCGARRSTFSFLFISMQLNRLMRGSLKKKRSARYLSRKRNFRAGGQLFGASFPL